ncbi:MAG: DUF819 family protein [Myxococcales bacterium]|nr:DUF819 family protein [Myxococcales bacterium]
MITSPTLVFALLAGVVALFAWLEARTKWRGFEVFPPLLWIYAVPVVLNNTGVLPRESVAYDLLGDIALPTLLVAMLISIDVRRTLRLLGRGLGVMVTASLGIVLGSVFAYALTRNALPPDAWKLYGALSGAWIGGTGNMLAVARGIGLPDANLGVAFLADNLVLIFWLPVLIASRRFAGRFARWSGADPTVTSVLDQASAPAGPTRPVTVPDLMYLIAVIAIVVAFADALAPRMPVWGAVLTAGSWRTLLLTTFAIVASFTPARHLAGSRELGVTLVYLFLAGVGARASMAGLANAPVFLAGAALLVAIHGAFCLLGARIFRADIHTAALASAANIGGAATAPVVAAHHREALVPASILMAMVGYASGNYLALLTTHLCSLLAPTN